MSEKDVYDLFVIGGGINGCGIARDAVGRGYSVFLAEMDDLASGTSSSSTKLVHGGLRYLEHYEFRLVREALIEREVLWKNAPHIIWPLRFVLPHHTGLRPAWLLRLGLFLYDHLGGRKLLPPTRVLDMTSDPAAGPLKQLSGKAFEYSDCWVNDARLVVLNARDAASRGAVIRTRTKVVDAKRADGLWKVTIADQLTGQSETVTARILVNAAGPWVDDVLNGVTHSSNAQNVRLVQGSHIVVRSKFDDPRAYIFQNKDDRIIFAIPYEDGYTLIGTTDHDYQGDPGETAITDEEIAYLCDASSEYFSENVSAEDVVWTYSGVRPLYDDGASEAKEATRDYVLVAEGGADDALLINVFGGKITTYRKLAEAMMEKIEKRLGAKKGSWTADAALPGGEFPATGFEHALAELQRDYDYLEPEHARRLMRLYGLEAKTILGESKRYEDLGKHFGGDLYAAEVDYLVAHEWARTTDDILWRRTKRGLVLTDAQVDDLSGYLVQSGSYETVGG
ncbi:MAG: glycerol-3-phosphate dehydrogenase [Alphaproteobacteria bacterium]|nr:glycerol-3-phosphate dehydrogenase [Alphaproteobacteria bacterium]